VADARGPGIRFPPPFVFVGGFLAAWLLEFLLGFEIDGEGPKAPQTILGLIAIVAGGGLTFWGMATFARARTPIIPNRPAAKLVLAGPYRFTRNPMYVGLTSLYTGLALLLNLAWAIVLLPLVLLVLTKTVIRHEERHLGDAFGSAYADYCGRVRRWL
jgi:protein-S-isoprenylcysteine O-methyltransferase Ste14